MKAQNTEAKVYKSEEFNTEITDKAVNIRLKMKVKQRRNLIKIELAGKKIQKR